MIGSLETTTLQEIWWIIISILGALFLFLNFVQGGQTLLWQVAKTSIEKKLVINSLGRKWEITFTTLVMFGGALFAAFPKFYATSFGGAYWVWMIILFTFIGQAVSYEYRIKPDNVYGAKFYEFLLFINGSVGILFIGAAVGTFFTGANFSLNPFNQMSWHHGLRGIEAAFNLFNLSLGLFLVINARTLGAQFLLNNLDLTGHKELETRLRKSTKKCFLVGIPFLLFVLIKLLMMDGQGIGPDGVITMVEYKYSMNLLAMPHLILFLLTGIGLIIWSVYITSFKNSFKGIWPAGLGTFLVGFVIFCITGFNGTPFYPSSIDMRSSLTIYNASSGHYTLTVMTYVAFLIPVVVGYVFYVWKQMSRTKIKVEELNDKNSY